ncbi:adenosine deaminase [Candidatus Merdisoma sp. JLR.KK006]|uniref:adenosine deaminase n=1 Tax=Candidatus Merdisoma sp. JLR.KK006 TaxID=3112626 RepID=UPI002FF2ADA8
MIDLHLHFDGSLLPRTILELAREQQLPLPAEDPDELKLFLSAPEDCESLNEYLEKFDLPLSVLQTKEAIRKAMYTLLSSLKEQGMLYAEVRFAPQSHLRKGLTQEDAVKAAILGMQEATAGSFFMAKLILCCMRGGDNQEANRKTIETAAAFLGRGVAAVDLAGAEALFPTADYEELFAYAKDLGLPFTIHAGEADGPESIEAGLRFGAARIGHGVRANEDEKVLGLLRESQIPLEMCPTSNVQTKAVSSFLEHPILRYLRSGLKVTVNTDNMTVSDTTIEREYRRLKTELGMTEEERKALLFNAADAAFLTEEERGRMKDVIGRIV